MNVRRTVLWTAYVLGFSYLASIILRMMVEDCARGGALTRGWALTVISISFAMWVGRALRG